MASHYPPLAASKGWRPDEGWDVALSSLEGYADISILGSNGKVLTSAARTADRGTFLDLYPPHPRV